MVVDLSKKENRTDECYAIALVQDECIIAESNFKKTNNLNAYKDAIKNIREYVSEFLIK